MHEQIDVLAVCSWWTPTSSKLAFVLITSPSWGLPPFSLAFVNFLDEADPPPSFESFALVCSLQEVLRYFLDLKTPESAGSDAAHQIYSPKALNIWKNTKIHYQYIPSQVQLIQKIS